MQPDRAPWACDVGDEIDVQGIAHGPSITGARAPRARTGLPARPVARAIGFYFLLVDFARIILYKFCITRCVPLCYCLLFVMDSMSSAVSMQVESIEKRDIS